MSREREDAMGRPRRGQGGEHGSDKRGADAIGRTEEEAPWDTVIRPTASWFDLRLGELWRYRDLVYLLVRRDFVAQYKQTILGPLWHLLQPLLTSVTFTVVFGLFARLPTEGLPPFLFYLSGTILWSYFANCATRTATTFVANAHLFGKVYFPRLAVPVATLISNLASMAVQILALAVIVVAYRLQGAPVHPNRWLLLAPLLVLLLAGNGLGIGILVSAMTTRYRDLANLVAFGIHLLMYATPVIYSVAAVPDRYRPILLANPLTAVIETSRYALLGVGDVSPAALLVSAATTLALLAAGLLLFNRVERTFMDNV